MFDEFVLDVDLDVAYRLVAWADMTTGPTGATVTVEERLAEIESRYGLDDVVTAFI